MAVKFSTSTNIIRDARKELNYIATSNAERAALTISESFKKGIHSYTLIGSYGTGKSTFLWALEQTLSGKKNLLPCKISQANGPVKVLNFVGVYQSLIEHFTEEFNIKNDFKGNQRILDALYQEYDKVKNKNGLLVIVIDEFGKFLEYAAKFEPEKELYFIQQLAEFANDVDRNILLITTLHQNFEAYSFGGLNETQRQEWRKIKGRLKEITFNEPAEQLLLLAAKRLSQLTKRSKAASSKSATVGKLEEKHHVFNTDKKLIKEIADSLAPLDFFSAFILTLSLQRYGQNERSLFTFLETEKLNTNNFRIPDIYDYLLNEYYSHLTSKGNTDYSQWAFMRHAIERCEAELDTHVEEGTQVLKTIGLLGLFGSKGARIDDAFLENYFKLSESNINVSVSLTKLKKAKIVRYNRYNNSYKIFEGTDVNIEDELLHAANDLADEIDLTKKLKEYFDLPFINAKSFSYRTGTSRFFTFDIIDELPSNEPEGEIDGYILLIFNDKIKIEDVKQHSLNKGQPNLYAYFKNSKQVRDLVFDIEKSRLVKEKNVDDKVARRELDNIIHYQRQLLNHFVWDAFYSGDVEWIFNGRPTAIKNSGELNRVLSDVCDAIYHKTPIFRNELINRHSISGPIHAARKNFFAALVNNSFDEDLNFPKENFPPEKTIYITLLRETKIHVKSDDGTWEFSEPSKRSAFYHLWQASEEFLTSCQVEKRPLTAFYEALSQKPFKLKQGFLEFWIPTYLFIKRDDYALFGDQGYMPEINEAILYLFTRNAKEFYIKTFDVRGVKLNLYNRYRQFLQLQKEPRASNKSFIESIRPFLVLYKQLPDYTKKTNRLSPETLAIRKAIENSQDPEKVFFEDFPKALKTDIKQLSTSKETLENYIANLQTAIRELRTALDELVERIEYFLTKEVLGDKKLKFPEYKTILQTRYSSLKEHQLLSKQRTFLMRINSPLDDRKSWVASITHAVLNKPIEQIKDEDEELLKDKLLFMVQEMDNLSEIQSQKREEGEQIIKLDLTTEEGLIKNFIRIPKSKKEEAKKLQTEIKKHLGKDKRVNIATLSELLKDQLKQDGKD